MLEDRATELAKLRSEGVEELLSCTMGGPLQGWHYVDTFGSTVTISKCDLIGQRHHATLVLLTIPLHHPCRNRNLHAGDHSGPAACTAVIQARCATAHSGDFSLVQQVGPCAS